MNTPKKNDSVFWSYWAITIFTSVIYFVLGVFLVDILEKSSFTAYNIVALPIFGVARWFIFKHVIFK